MHKLKRNCLLKVLVSILVISSCREKTESNTGKFTIIRQAGIIEPELSIDLGDFLPSNKLKASVVHIKYDHFFKTSKSYLGYSLKTLLDTIIKQNNFDTSNAMVVLECKDGYKPQMELSKIYGKVNGYVAFKDLDPDNINDWTDSLKDKLSPYYLVWDNVLPEDDTYMWPYGLVRIKLTSINVVYESIYPWKDSTLIRGFNLFRMNCMKCHSINNVGGTMGPEFNIPKNITEYWKDKDILEFAKNPTAYRKNSDMPAMPNIPEADYNEMISYLKYMKDFKKSK